MRKLSILPGCALLLLLASCSHSPDTATKKEPPKPPDPVSGQSALFKMFQSARAWGGSDMKVLKLTSMTLAEVPDVPRGKAAAWEAQFTSASRSQSRSYTYSIMDVLPSLHKGVFAGPESGWSGPHGVSVPFEISAVKIDSDAAYQTALTKSEDYDKKNPGKAISLLLEMNNRYPNPVWRVIWGESAGTSNYSVFVDAYTGDYREKMR